MSKGSLVLGSRLETLQLGRYKGRLVNIFENPELGAHTVTVADKIRTLSENSALEFLRMYNVGAISVVVAVPPVASLIFGIVWIRVYANKNGTDLQLVIQTAFTVSSYIVTAGKTHDVYVSARPLYRTLTSMNTGALTLALIAFLDQKRAQNDDMMERIARRSVETKAAAFSKLDRRSSLP